jgi:ABC-type Fe3+-hydroxamate transport system substrate-binding protein
MGRTVSVPDDVQRIVSLVPSITETLYSFGRGAHVVGITEYCTEPAAEVAGQTRIGGTKNPDISQIRDLHPQLVFAVAEENRRHDVEQLDAAGIPVYVFEPRTVRHGIALLWRIADILGCYNEVAGQISAIETVYEATRVLVATRRRLRVFCPIWKDPYMTINEDTYVHDMLWVCGGDNIFARRQRRFPLAADLGAQPARINDRAAERDRRYPRLTLQEMAALRPEVILLPDEPYVFTAADLGDFTPFAEVPAVQHQRIHLIDGKIVSWYGPRIGHSLQTLRALLGP